MATRQTSSMGLFALPIIVMGTLHLVITPLGELLAISWLYATIWYVISIGIGILLLRRARRTKDHEYRRSEIMKKMKHVYEAEAKGVWDKDTPLQTDVQLNKASLDTNVGAFGRERPELELDPDQKSDVQMLTEQGFVQKATRRMSGENKDIEETVDSTVGSVRKKSWMDGIIDGIFGLFGKDKAAEREEKRLLRLRANAQQEPVIAQRPVAPIKVAKTTDESSSDVLTMTSMSDDGGIISATSNKPAYVQIQPKESIEDLAMLGGTARPTVSMAISGGCPSCGAANPVSERYCQACGSTLSAE